MAEKKKWIRTGVLGLLSLLGSVAAFVGFQTCFVQSFFLHALIAPLNPRTIHQFTPFDYLRVIFEILFPVLLFAGCACLLHSAYLLYRGKRKAIQV